jgi:hypothetical protein
MSPARPESPSWRHQSSFFPYGSSSSSVAQHLLIIHAPTSPPSSRVVVPCNNIPPPPRFLTLSSACACRHSKLLRQAVASRRSLLSTPRSSHFPRTERLSSSTLPSRTSRQSPPSSFLLPLPRSPRTFFLYFFSSTSWSQDPLVLGVKFRKLHGFPGGSGHLSIAAMIAQNPKP